MLEFTPLARLLGEEQCIAPPTRGKVVQPQYWNGTIFHKIEKMAVLSENVFIYAVYGGLGRHVQFLILISLPNFMEDLIVFSMSISRLHIIIILYYFMLSHFNRIVHNVMTLAGFTNPL